MSGKQEMMLDSSSDEEISEILQKNHKTKPNPPSKRRGPYGCMTCGKGDFGHTRASHDNWVVNTFSFGRADLGNLLKGFAYSIQPKFELSNEEVAQLRYAPPLSSPDKSWEQYLSKKDFQMAYLCCPGRQYLSLLAYQLTRSRIENYDLQGPEVFEWALALASNSEATIKKPPKSSLEMKEKREAIDKEVIVLGDEDDAKDVSSSSSFSSSFSSLATTPSRKRKFGFHTIQDLGNTSFEGTPFPRPTPMTPFGP